MYDSTHFAIGTADFLNDRLENGEEHFARAFKLWREKSTVQPVPLVVMCIYRLGCIALRQNKTTIAM